MSLILSGSDGVSDIDGSASTPAIRGTDANTGIFFPAADTIAFAEGGAEAMRIDSSGNVLVGSTSNSNTARMKIDGGTRTIKFFDLTATGGENWIFDSTITVSSTDVFGIYALGATGLYIQDNGNVGIGTSSPSFASGGGLNIFNSSAARLALKCNATGANDGLQLGIDTGGNAFIEQRQNAPLLFATNSTERARITSAGTVGINTTSPDASTVLTIKARSGENGMAVKAGTNGNYGIYFNNTSDSTVGGIIINASTTTYATSSDYRLKENVAPMTGALAKVLELNPVTYTWKSDGSDGQGFIAHELQAVVPDAVTGEKDGEEMQGVDYGKLTPILTAALQEAIAEIQSLKARIAVLEAK